MIIFKLIKLILMPIVLVVQLALSLLAFLLDLVGVMLELVFAIAGSLGVAAAIFGVVTGKLEGASMVILLVASLFLASITICIHRWGVSGIHTVKRAFSRIF